MVCGGPRGVWLSCGGGCGRGLRARGFRILPYVRLSSVRQIMQPLGCDPRTVAHFADIAPRPLLWSLSACTLQWLMRTMGEIRDAGIGKILGSASKQTETTGDRFCTGMWDLRVSMGSDVFFISAVSSEACFVAILHVSRFRAQRRQSESLALGNE